MNKSTIKIIKKYFAKQPLVSLVYLYGSQAREEATDESDIDLAILVDEEKTDESSQLQLQVMSDLSRILSCEVEVQNLNICKISFAYRVIAEGKIIYVQSDHERIIFEEQVMRDYFDLKPLNDEYEKSLAERARRGLLSGIEGVKYG